MPLKLKWYGSAHAQHYDVCRRIVPSLTVGSTAIQPVNVAGDLGVLLDSELTMKQHVNLVTTISFCHLRRHVSQAVITAVILRRLDYCNSILTGLPLSTLAPLQRIQKAAARIVSTRPRQAGVERVAVSPHHIPYQVQETPAHVPCSHALLSGRPTC